MAGTFTQKAFQSRLDHVVKYSLFTLRLLKYLNNDPQILLFLRLLTHWYGARGLYANVINKQSTNCWFSREPNPGNHAPEWDVLTIEPLSRHYMRKTLNTEQQM